MCDRIIQTKISPHYPEAKLDNPSFDDLVDVLEDRITYWVIEPAKLLASDEIYQVAGFCIALTYFEGIWPYIQGRGSKGNSKHFFIEAFIDVFRPSGHPESIIREVAEVFYGDARCGFFHEGMFRDHIFFKKLDRGELLITPVNKKIESILVDSAKFITSVERHFSGLIAALRDPSSIEKRKTFEKMCKKQWDWEGPARYIGIDNPMK